MRPCPVCPEEVVTSLEAHLIEAHVGVGLLRWTCGHCKFTAQALDALRYHAIRLNHPARSASVRVDNGAVATVLELLDTRPAPSYSQDTYWTAPPPLAIGYEQPTLDTFPKSPVTPLYSQLIHNPSPPRYSPEIVEYPTITLSPRRSPPTLLQSPPMSRAIPVKRKRSTPATPKTPIAERERGESGVCGKCGAGMSRQRLREHERRGACTLEERRALKRTLGRDCPHCGATFRDPADTLRHLSRRFKCTQVAFPVPCCGRTFRTPLNYGLHRKKAHSTEATEQTMQPD